MIREITISNYKSIDELSLSLGTVNVFIGENGAGKSNVLEALALAAAAHADKLDNEFLSARGVRVTSANHMRSGFEPEAMSKPIKLSVQTDKDQSWTANITHDNKPYSTWQRAVEYEPSSSSVKDLFRLLSTYFDYNKNPDENLALLEDIKRQLDDQKEILSSGDLEVSIPITVKFESQKDFTFSLTDDTSLSSFLIFSPEDSALRAFEKEGQVEPLGTHGEGLFKLLKVMSDTEPENFALIQENLQLLGWFDRLSIASSGGKDSIDISDLYLHADAGLLDQRSANEGFLFLAFYFALFSSSLTPNFFAIDNIDASLNPRLCRELIKRLAKLAKDKGKQVIFTTHNAAILDGLDIKDDEQRLFVIYRNDEGGTRARRVRTKPLIDKENSSRLSDLFMRGMIGGLPKGF